MARNEPTEQREQQKESKKTGRADERERQSGREGSSLASQQPMRGELVQRGGGGGPFSFFERMFADMNRLFEDFGMGSVLAPSGRGLGMIGGLGEWSPQVEVLERDGNLIVRADLPGVKQEDVKVRIDEGALIVSGERRSDRTEEREGYWRSERSYGSFERVIPLPSDVDPSTCDARFENGVLEVQLKLPEQAPRGREIPIQSGSARAGGATAEPKNKSVS